MSVSYEILYEVLYEISTIHPSKFERNNIFRIQNRRKHSHYLNIRKLSIGCSNNTIYIEPITHSICHISLIIDIYIPQKRYIINYCIWFPHLLLHINELQIHVLEQMKEIPT